MNNNQKKIFISYSKHDIQHKEMLLKQLSGLRDRIITWNDRDIQAGEEWDERIKAELHKADVVLYLVSANSMATDYIQKDELPLIENRCQKGQCVLVPIIVDFCDWQEQGFAKYNALPEKGIPVTDKKHWDNENQAWLSVITEIKRIIRFELAVPPQQPYLSHYADDIVIHAAANDLNFAETFRIELQKHLAAKLGGFKFRLRLQTNNDDFSQAAIVIVLLSENYLQQYGDSFQILPQLQQKCLMLVEVDKTQKPESLAEVMEYTFCQQIRQNTLTYQATDSGYQLSIAELVIELDGLLQQLKSRHDPSNNITVFINVAPEDRELGKQVQKLLAQQYQLASALPATTGTRSDIGNKYQFCQAVLFIYVQGSEEWVDNQLLTCAQTLSEHQKKYKIIAIHTNEQQITRMNVSLPHLNLHEYFSPPESLQAYLSRFVEALQ
jgi:hypothetical protein